MELYEQALKRVIAIIVEFEPQDIQALNGKTLFNTLGLDSLDSLEVVMAIEDEFGIEVSDEEAEAAARKTVGHFAELVIAKLGERPMPKLLVIPPIPPRREGERIEIAVSKHITVSLTPAQAAEYDKRGGEKWLRKSLNTKRKAK